MTGDDSLGVARDGSRGSTGRDPEGGLWGFGTYRGAETPA